MKYHDGRRLCMRCLEALVPGSLGWTWGFGTCLCGHFGITVDAEAPEALAKLKAEPQQDTLF